jgi:hypothetical protein
MTRVQPGSPLRIAARDWNAAMDAAEAYSRSQWGWHDVRGLTKGVLVAKNTSAEDVLKGNVLGINGPVFSQSDNEGEFFHNLALSCAKPTANHLGKWCLALETIPAGKFGAVATTGVLPVRLALGYADHPFADIADGSWTLASNWYGAAEILWTQSTSGSTFALIRLGTFQTVPLRVTVTATGGIAAGASGEVTVAGTSPAQTLTAYLDWAHGNEKISYGKQAFVKDCSSWQEASFPSAE